MNITDSNAKCLCKKEDGTDCGYIGTYKSIGYHLRHKHNQAPQKRGETFEITTEPTNFSQRHSVRKKDDTRTTNATSAMFIDLPAFVRINVLTKERVVILGE